MEVYQVDKYCKNNNICCDLVIKTKLYLSSKLDEGLTHFSSKEDTTEPVHVYRYVNILLFESRRLCSLQIECNQLLDIFYGLKDEFDFLLKEGLLIKYLGADDNLAEDYTKEFTVFAVNVWHIGKQKFSEKGKKVRYLCYVGKLLSEVMILINSFVDEVMFRLNYMPFHSECTATIHTICNQIYAELQSDCLKSADACLHQYVYLQAVTPFLRVFNGLINQFILLPNIHTPKQFIDRIILKIPSIEEILSKEDTKDTKPFRFVVNLLNGKLLNDKVLDQNSDIRPIVEDDVNFKRSITVNKTVEWIIQQYNIKDIPMVAKTGESINDDKKNFLYKNQKLFGHNVSDLFEPIDFNKIDWFGLYNSQLSSQRKLSRRVRKSSQNTVGTRLSDDLQPIKLQTLQTPLLPPLL